MSLIWKFWRKKNISTIGTVTGGVEGLQKKIEEEEELKQEEEDRRIRSVINNKHQKQE